MTTPPTLDPATPPTRDPATPPTRDPATPPTRDPATPPTHWLSEVADAHRRMLDVLDTLGEADVRTPSNLPGWTIGHVLTHLARNADGGRNMVEGAVRDEISPQYPGGREQRNADIEAGAGRPYLEIVADIARASAALEAAWRALPDDTWRRLGRGSSGAELTMAEWVFRRWREVEIHLVDLGTDRYLPSDWPPAYVTEELRRIITDHPDQPGLLLWLAGRADAPEPPPWP
jgi:maleylpyruvate isomerase